MTEEIKVPEVQEEVKNVEAAPEQAPEAAAEPVETVEPKAEAAEPASEESAAKPELNLAGKTLSEISDVFKSLMESADRMTRSKEAEGIKTAFYRLLTKLKSEASEVGDKFDEVEENFKSIYSDYKRERAEYNKEQDALKAENLEKKKAIIEDLKALVEESSDASSNFPAFREIQNRWRAVGPVPASDYRDLNSNYQYYVEKFYDSVKISRELRDLDFKKNLEAKEQLCEEAEKLAEDDNVVRSFNELQKLHEQWKEFGPVAKEFRDSIWARFQAATSTINKKYQAHFEELKGQQKENLAAKEALCEKVEEIANREIKSSGEWTSATKEITDIQAEWRKIGFATKKENQKIYDRFRAACDKFFAAKKEFYGAFKGEKDDNLAKKQAIIDKANELKNSTEWKKTTEAFIDLQKQWKEIGAVSRKKSEQLWKQFRAACDEFFAERDKNAAPENNYYTNLKAKKKLIEEVKAYEGSDDEAMNKFAEQFKEIGFVPFKEKDSINAAFAEAMKAKFPNYSQKLAHNRGEGRPSSERDQLIRKYNALQQEIETYENNIGFFSASKGAEAIIKQTQDKIDKAKEELAALKEQIRKAEQGEA